MLIKAHNRKLPLVHNGYTNITIFILLSYADSYQFIKVLVECYLITNFQGQTLKPVFVSVFGIFLILSKFQLCLV